MKVFTFALLASVTVPSLGQVSYNLNNYSNDPFFPGNYQYNAFSLRCSQTLLPLDNGNYSSSNCFTIPFDNDWSPGWDYGSPGTLSDQNWFLNSLFSAFTSSYSAGIKNGASLVGNYTGPGDINFLNIAVNTKPAAIAGSDEGIHATYRSALTELSPYLGTIAVGGGGSGATSLTLSCTSSCSNLGLNSPFIDLSSGVLSGNISSFSQITVSGSPLALADTSFSVASSASVMGTLSGDVDVPRTAANNSGQLSSASRTFNINTTVALSVGQLIDIIGPAFNDVALVTYAGALSGGIQQITATLHYSHTNNAVFCAGGAVGSYIEMTNYTSGINRYLHQVYCSPTTTSVWLGYQRQNGFYYYYNPVGPVTMYQGGEVVGVINPSNGQPSNNFVAVMANNASWNDNDMVENVNNISTRYNDTTQLDSVINPFPDRIAHDEVWGGTGGGLSPNSGSTIFTNSNLTTQYQGAGGNYIAPFFLATRGATTNAIVMETAPLQSGTRPVNLTYCQTGWFLCAGTVDPAATSQLVGVFSMGDQNSYINYDHTSGNQVFNIVSQGGVNVSGPLAATVYTGPATAPSGSCATVGWVFSQDGHATFCNGTTWITKI